jgi:Zn-dependent protease
VFGLSPAELLRLVPAILIGFTVHELAHAWVALRLGDDTPRLMGRLTWNPLKHVDLFGFILLLVAGFGWAKPVMINRANLKNPVRDDILIALAGPLSNLACALLLAVLLKGVVELVPFGSRDSFQAVTSVFLVFITINVSLGLFNLLPIPPLDGSHVVSNLLSGKGATIAAVCFRYGSYALLAVILLEWILKVDILPVGRAVHWVVRLLLRLVGLA